MDKNLIMKPMTQFVVMLAAFMTISAAAIYVADENPNDRFYTLIGDTRTVSYQIDQISSTQWDTKRIATTDGTQSSASTVVVSYAEYSEAMDDLNNLQSRLEAELQRLTTRESALKLEIAALISVGAGTNK